MERLFQPPKLLDRQQIHPSIASLEAKVCRGRGSGNHLCVPSSELLERSSWPTGDPGWPRCWETL